MMKYINSLRFVLFCFLTSVSSFTILMTLTPCLIPIDRPIELILSDALYYL